MYISFVLKYFLYFLIIVRKRKVRDLLYLICMVLTTLLKQNNAKVVRVKLGFYYRNKCCFSFGVRKGLIQATFLSILDYSDILYMHANQSSLKMLDSVHHTALRFATNSGSPTLSLLIIVTCMRVLVGLLYTITDWNAGRVYFS